MKGSMREKRPGYWELRVFAGVDPLTGQKQYRTRTFRGTKRQASSALAVLVTEVDGGVVEPKKCSVAELLAAWLEHIENVGRSPDGVAVEPTPAHGLGKGSARHSVEPEHRGRLPARLPRKEPVEVVHDLRRDLGQWLSQEARRQLTDEPAVPVERRRSEPRHPGCTR